MLPTPYAHGVGNTYVVDNVLYTVGTYSVGDILWTSRTNRGLHMLWVHTVNDTVCTVGNICCGYVCTVDDTICTVGYTSTRVFICFFLRARARCT